MIDITKYDEWFQSNGPAALVIREHLIPIEGADGVFFPATYAAQPGSDKDKEKFQGGYNIDFFSDGTNVCLVDSVGSQANRIEPFFADNKYSELVPQNFVIFPSKGIRINWLHANHRAADAIIRCSAFEKDLRKAFQEVQRGNYENLAKIAPTSLVFGVWDSRDTQAKIPRLFSSTIRAFNVRNLTRSANFLTQMTIDLAKLEILPGAESKDGFANALESKAPGGVQLAPNGYIRRDTTIALAALRRLSVLDASGSLNLDKTKSLRRYILGLSLVSLTAPIDPFLRQGCNLVPDTDKGCEFKLVNIDGTRVDYTLLHKDAVEYAHEAMNQFGIQSGEEKPFDASIAEKANAAKPEKMNGSEVISVDSENNAFKVKFKKKDFEIGTNSETVIKKGKDIARFETIIKVGAKVDLEVKNGVAISITSKK